MAPRANIVIRPNGRFGNQMFQVMLARAIAARIPGSRVFGYNLPEWRLVAPDIGPFHPPYLEFHGQRINLADTAALLKSGLFTTLVIFGWGMRLDYYDDAEVYRRLFRSSRSVRGFGREHIVIHVRGEDVMRGLHPDYAPMPLSFYEAVIRSTGLAPVFMGQIDDGPYCQALRERFPGAAFLEPSSVITDFERLRNSRNIVLSVSSFAWLAAWLSHAERIHLPVWGLFDPEHYPDASLLPLEDERYVYYKIAPFEWTGARAQLDRLTSSTVDVTPVSKEALTTVARRVTPRTRT
jgi:hypothetical protein